MPPSRRSHGRPPGMPSRYRLSATPSPRSAARSGVRWNYPCPGKGSRPSKFPCLCCSAWSTPSPTPPDAALIRPFGETLNRSDQVMAGGKSSLGVNMAWLEERAKECGYNLYDALVRRVDSTADVLEKVRAI